MTIIEEDLRRSLNELAGEGRPVDLGRAALAGARRRRRIRLGFTATAGAAAVVLAVPVGLAGGPAPDRAEPTGASRVVITYYLGGDPLAGYALDTVTGVYERDGLPPNSPDLRGSLTAGNAFVVSLADGSRSRVPWLRPVGGAVWSPDSSRIAGFTPDDSLDAVPPVWLAGTVQVAEPESGTGWEIPLDLPAGHRATGLFWLDDRRLAVPVAEPGATVEVPPRYEWRTGSSTASEGGGSLPVVDEVQVYAVEGALEARILVDQRDYAASQDPGRLWQVSRIVSEGTVLLFRHPDDATLELASVDAGRISSRVVLNLPEPPAGQFWSPATAVFPLAGGRLLVEAELQVEPRDGDQSLRWVKTEFWVVDLATGRVRSADVPPLPGGGRPWSYGDAAALPPASAHLGFTP